MPKQIGRAAEEPAAKVFQAYLRDHSGVYDLAWDKGADPPDRVMSHGKRSFAVEITTLIESVPPAGKRPRNLQESIALHQALVKSIENEALDARALDGAYSVCFGFSIVGRRELEKEVRKLVLLYLQSTRGAEQAPIESYPAPRSSRTLVWLVKHHTRYPRLASAPPPISAFEGECLAEAQRVLDERVSEKAERLRCVSSPRVLLLWDATSLLETEHFLRATRRPDWLESIEAAYLVRGSQEVHEFWSGIDVW